jgi:protein TonB
LRLYINPAAGSATRNLISRGGVYSGMFDQSLLLDRGGTRKASAVAASFVAQMLAAGVLLIAPLLYREALPARLRLAADYYPLRAAEQPRTAQAAPESKGVHVNARPAFRAPSPREFAAAPAASVGFADAPALDLATSQPGFAQSAATLLTNLAPPPPKPTPASQPAATPQSPPAPVRISQGVLAAKLIRKLVPMYPPLARQARVQGTVRLLGTVDRDGSIQHLQVLSGHPLLVEAALAAVRQWVYRPTLLNGEPVQVLAPIDVTFTLSP